MKGPVNTEDDRWCPNPIQVFLIEFDLQCVDEHYHVGELAYLCLLISAVFLQILHHVVLLVIVGLCCNRFTRFYEAVIN